MYMHWCMCRSNVAQVCDALLEWVRATPGVMQRQRGVQAPCNQLSCAPVLAQFRSFDNITSSCDDISDLCDGVVCYQAMSHMFVRVRRDARAFALTPSIGDAELLQCAHVFRQ